MTAPAQAHAAFSPALAAADPLLHHWMRQAMLRLRREVCWAWRERTGKPGGDAAPPFSERLVESLDRAR